jgi:hypothetical protein
MTIDQNDSGFYSQSETISVSEEESESELSAGEKNLITEFEFIKSEDFFDKMKQS